MCSPARRVEEQGVGLSWVALGGVSRTPASFMLAKNLTPGFVKLFPIAGPKVASYGQIIAFSVSLLGFGGFWLLQGGHRGFDGRFTGVLGLFWRAL